MSSPAASFRGYSDRPTCEDALGMEDKYRGLAKFICECETPMTIAINGDWGSGKSSAMQIIQQHLADYAEGSIEQQLIRFNTWEFSVVSDNSKLVFELLQTLNEKLGQLEELYGGCESRKNAKDTGRLLMAIGGAVKGAALGVLEDSGIKPILDIARGAGEALEAQSDGALETFVYTSPTRLLRNVSRKIEERIQSIVSKLPRLQRLFIFVDDLDRLEPGTALELIEGMKNFASYENCVFVLAVDQSVVERGLKSKYGNEISDEMAQHFFDKIIQLPFKLPVNAYNLSSYVQSLLEKSDAPDSGDMAGTAKKFAALLKAFHITNPRTIKRSFNMLHMYQCMNECRAGTAPGQPGFAPQAGGRKESVDRYYKQYALLLLLLTSPEDHAKMAQLVDSGCAYADSGELAQIQRDFQALRQGADGGACSDYITAVLDLFYDGGDSARATTELIDALTFTKSDDVDHDSYALAQFLLELLTKIDCCPQNKAAILACEGWAEAAHSSSPYALAMKSGDICIELDGLAGESKLKISWERSKRFFISLHSPQLRQEQLDALDCFNIRNGSGSPSDWARRPEDKLSCYFFPGRITVFIANTRHTDKLFQLMSDCGVFGPTDTPAAF